MLKIIKSRDKDQITMNLIYINHEDRDSDGNNSIKLDKYIYKYICLKSIKEKRISMSKIIRDLLGNKKYISISFPNASNIPFAENVNIHLKNAVDDQNDISNINTEFIKDHLYYEIISDGQKFMMTYEKYYICITIINSGSDHIYHKINDETKFIII